MSETMWETIVVLEGQAGQAILLGYQDGELWSFKKKQDPLLLIENPVVAHTLKEGLLLLGQSWSFLTPLYVHPQFRAELWKEVKQTRSLTQLTHWRMKCI